MVGFKNFADVNIVSIASTDDKNRSKASVGVSSNVSVIVSDLVSEDESLHKTYDFDLVTENYKKYWRIICIRWNQFSNKLSLITLSQELIV